MKNALIVLNFNDFKSTQELINNVKNYNSLDYIIIVDNCSTNESFSELSKFESKKIRVLKTKKNGGYAYGNNYGIKYAISEFDIDYAIVANPDIYFEESIINEFNNEILKYPQIGIIAPRLLDGNDNFWKTPKYVNILACPFLFLNKRYGNNKYNKKEKNNEFVDVVSGAFFAITTKAYVDVDGFDEETFLYFEENIIGFKLKEKGYRNYIIKDLFFKHKGSTTIDLSFNSSRIKPYKIYLQSVNIYAKKYLKINIVKVILLYICFFFGFIERLFYDMILKIYRKKNRYSKNDN